MEQALARVEKLLSMILLHDMKDAHQEDKALALSRAGFSNAEIAEMLGTTGAVVAQQLYELRRGKKRRPAKAKRNNKR
jgi:hypothetical protein